VGLAPWLLVLLVPGCTDERGTDDPGRRLRLSFPERSDDVLGTVALAPPAALGWLAATRLEVELPRRAEQPIRMRAHDLVFEVRELGLTGSATHVDDAVRYARVDGESFWTVGPRSAENWLLLPHGAGDGPVGSWLVEGATLRQRGEAIEIASGPDAPARVRVTAPAAYGPGGEPLPVELRAVDDRIEVSVPPGPGPLLVDPMWLATANDLTTSRRRTAIAHLGDETVLVPGGDNGNVATTTGDLYTPASDTWAAAVGTMQTDRQDHTATTLLDGTAIVAGGVHDQGSGLFGTVASADLYSPGSGFAPAADMQQDRAAHTATQLDDGRVLVAGGAYGSSGFFFSPLDHCEIYDPGLTTWVSTGFLNQGRLDHRAVNLVGGDVIVTGGSVVWSGPGPQPAGISQNTLGSVEIWSQVTELWSFTASMNEARKDHGMVRLIDGRIFVVGGENDFDSALESAEIYDPQNPGWTTVTPLGTGRRGLSATLLLTGEVLVAGGRDDGGTALDSAEIYDPFTDSWTPTPDMLDFRSGHVATRLENGEVLVAGGGNDVVAALATAERYQSLKPNGETCMAASECMSNECADGVCCDTACSGGPCDACSIQAGAEADGTCVPIEPVAGACDDANECTIDACDATLCANVSKLDGTPCTGGVCIAGVCVPDASGPTTDGAGGGSSGPGPGAGGSESTASGPNDLAPPRLEGGGICSARVPEGRTRSWWLLLLALLPLRRRSRPAPSAGS
jgi:hypothetical protein